MRYRVMISAPYMQPVIDRFAGELREAGCDHFCPTVHERLEESDLLKLVGDVDAIVCGDDRLTRRVLESARRLRVISKWGTGIDSIDKEACRDLGIRLCNTPNAFTIPVADSTFAYMLAFARRSFEQVQLMRSGAWDKLPGVTLAESTVGVIGVGAIGREVARRASVFGARVLGCDPIEPSPRFIAETGIEMTGLESLLRQSDFVTLHTDLNPSSRHLMNRETIALMKRSAVLINTSRGPVVKEVDLIDALERGIISGAGLDVFEHEPLPVESPLRRMANVMCASHNSNSSPAAWERVHRSTLDQMYKGLREVQRRAA